MSHTKWPSRNELQKATKGRFALQSQSVQMVVHAFLANVETTRQLRKTHPQMKMKYPWRTKRFYPVSWPAQAVCKEPGRVILPMGKGRKSLVLPLDLPAESGACTLCWNNGFELHVCVDIPQADSSPGEKHATVDLGEIHLAAVSTNTGKALIVTGRGIRSLKRQRNQQLGRIAKKQARCTKYSRRWKKLQKAKNKQCRRAERRIRNQRHQATRKVITFCVENQVGSLFIGNPHGVRNQNNGRHHNQQEELDAMLAQVQVPTTILWGTGDQLLPLTSAHDLHTGIAHSKLVLLTGVGHAPQVKAAAEVARIILNDAEQNE